MANVSSTSANKVPKRARVQIARSHNLAVRTDLRAGLAWDDLDDKAKDLLNSVSSTLSTAVNGVTGSTTGTTTN